MAVHVGTSVLTQTTDNGNSVLEVSGNYCGIERISSIGGRDAGNVGTALEYEWNRVNNNNAPSGSGISGARYTAPWSGSYMVYIWVMCNNGTTENNARYRVRINNSSDNRQVYAYSSNGGAYHREWATGIVVNLAAGDFVSLYTDNLVVYGNADEYTRFNVVFLG